ncbi:MAG: RNA polymerase sigma factor [Roseburia sp.]
MNKDDFIAQVLEAEGSLYRVAKSILHNDEDCADAIQNGILKAYQKLDTLQNEKYFKTWLTRIVINECYQFIRNEQKHVALDEFPGWDAEAVESAEGESMVMLELMQLDEKYRIPIVLHEIEGYSAKEIAKILGLSETNVGNRIFRGKKILKKSLEGAV